MNIYPLGYPPVKEAAESALVEERRSDPAVCSRAGVLRTFAIARLEMADEMGSGAGICSKSQDNQPGLS
jgi:hypothetical protein